MGWTRRIAAVVLAAWCSGCTGLGVGVEFDPSEDFSSYRTWAWMPRLEPAPDPFEPTPEALSEEIVMRTEEALAERGFVRADSADADFFVTYHVEIHTEIHIDTETPAEQYVGSFNDSPSYGVTKTTQRRRVYERGHLVIDVAAAEGRQLVWRGSAESKYRGSWKPHARAAVFEILGRFPPDRSVAGAAEDEAGS